MKGHRQSRFLIIALIFSALAIFYFFADPNNPTGFMPKCIVHAVTGYDCPGCGLQRMIHALLHLDFYGAWHANAFLLCSLPYLAFMVLVDMRRHSWTKLYQAVNSMPAIIIYSVAIIAWGIGRNLFI